MKDMLAKKEVFLDIYRIFIRKVKFFLKYISDSEKSSINNFLHMD